MEVVSWPPFMATLERYRIDIAERYQTTVDFAKIKELTLKKHIQHDDDRGDDDDGNDHNDYNNKNTASFPTSTTDAAAECCCYYYYC